MLVKNLFHRLAGLTVFACTALGALCSSGAPVYICCDRQLTVSGVPLQKNTTVGFFVGSGNKTTGNPLEAPAVPGYEFKGWCTIREDGKAWTSVRSSDFNLDQPVWTAPTISDYSNVNSASGTKLVWLKYEKSTYKITLDGHDIDKYQIETNQQTKTFTPPDKGGHTLLSISVTGASGGSPSATTSGTLTIPAGTYDDLTLTSNWKANEYKITLVENDGSGGALSTTTYTTDTTKSQTVTITNPTKAGYTFESWSVTIDGSGSTSISLVGNKLTIQKGAYGNITLTANWKAASYSIKIDPDGGSAGGASPNAYKMDIGASQSITITLPTKTGYRIASWTITCAGSGSPEMTGTTTLSIPAGTYGDITLTPTWIQEVAKYMLTVNPNGGKYKGSSDPVTIEGEFLIYGTTNLNAIAPATQDGYAFDGYWDAYSGGNRVYDETGRNVKGNDIYWTANYPSGTFKGSKNLTVYAHWRHNTTVVTLDFDGGIGGTNSVVATYDEPMPALNDLPTKKGYEFDGYYTLKDGAGIQYYKANGTSAETWRKMESTYTLYAKWAPHSYTITYDLDGGEFKSGSEADSNAKHYGTYFYVSAPVRDGAKFIGWQVIGSDVDYETAKCGKGPSSIQTSIESGEQLCVNDEKGAVYFLNLTAKNDGKVTLRANWDVARYKLVIVPNGGYYNEPGEYYRSVDPFELGYQSLIYGETNCNVIGTCVRQGYDFKGYTYDTSSVYDEYGRNKLCDWWSANYPNGTFRGAADLRITAKWVVHEYHIALDAQGGEGGASSTTATLHDSMEKIAVPKRIGYAFGGYFTKKDGKGTQYYDEEGKGTKSWEEDDDECTLYAYWEPIEYMIRFDGNGVEDQTGTMTNIGPVKYGQPVKLTPNAFVNDKRSFKGWNGSDKKHYDDEAVVSNLTATADEVFVMTADWGSEYWVEFDGNGATNTVMETLELKRDVAANLPPNEYARVGYAFLGWATNATGSAVFADKASVTNIAEAGSTFTLYAVWKANEYTVFFDLNGGGWKEEYENPLPCVYDESWPMPGAPTNSNELYQFNGWGCEATGCVYQPETMVSNLTAEADGIVTLKATWKFDEGDYSRALGCTNLVFDADGDTGWSVVTNGANVYVQHSVKKDSEDALRANIAQGGKLTFRWYASVSGISLWVNDNEYQSSKGNQWQDVSVDIDGEDERIAFTTDTGNSDYVYLADVRWTPDGATPDEAKKELTDAGFDEAMASILTADMTRYERLDRLSKATGKPLSELAKTEGAIASAALGLDKLLSEDAISISSFTPSEGGGENAMTVSVKLDATWGESVDEELLKAALGAEGSGSLTSGFSKDNIKLTDIAVDRTAQTVSATLAPSSPSSAFFYRVHVK